MTIQFLHAKLDPDLHAGVDDDFDAFEPAAEPFPHLAQSLIAAGLLEPIP